MSLLSKIFGDANEKVINRLQKRVEEINALEQKIQSLTASEFKQRTQEFKEKLADKEYAEQQNILNEILPECFALVREAAKRTLGQRHYDVQLLASMVLHEGNISEMKTGEGKTLAATAAVYLNALTGRGVHVITVNDYLARRDAVWMGQVYAYLGLSTGCLNHEIAYLYQDKSEIQNPKSETNSNLEIQNDKKDELDKKRDVVGGYKIVEDYLLPVPRRLAYGADITYGTNNEFGFDYLRDNMVQSLNYKVQRSLHFVIVDEVDSILIDEARTPLIISAPDSEPTDKYRQFSQLVSRLEENTDYNIDEKMKSATLTEAGIKKMEKWLGVENIYTDRGIRDVHHVEQALRARVLFKKDRDYVTKDGEIIIVDEFTGRLMLGRRYSDGLHQAIEAKEGVQIKQESVTMATITFQNYFRMYQKLSGMTGTAATEGEEFAKIYNLDVIIIPTNKPMVRLDKSDVILKTVEEKYNFIVQEVKKRHEKGQPVLVGTISIENNEYLSELLSRAGVPHQVLNAKQHEKEAEIIAQAGKLGAVTIATNMAGRGVDIILGGNPPDLSEQEKVKAAGGLCVIGSERHESRRIDNQLRGRAGRQGDSGESQFFVSMEDDLMRIFGGERLKSLMNTLGLPDGMPIENKLISNSIEKAQMKVEGHNFDIRKHLVEYDDVINKHRETIYRKRNEILLLARTNAEDNADLRGQDNEKLRNKEIKKLREIVLDYVKDEIVNVVNFHTSSEHESEWNLKEIFEVMNTIFSAKETLEIEQLRNKEIEGNNLKEKLINYFYQLAAEQYTELENKINNDENLKKQFGEKIKPMNLIETTILLRSIDTLWVEHIDAMDHMRTGIGLVGYGQKDPLVEYKNQAHRLFKELLENIRRQVVYSIFKVSVSPTASQRQVFSDQQQVDVNSKLTVNKEKVGRNDPCPCGATKPDGSPIKFKHCHGK
ncbi:MAG TPA: preprotein translocase subunit SecA [bacterium]|nr:preprotein translocase subunit SecA [bacterium]HPL95481.1 preprotein translocase subunit SecA [bacterium]